MEQGNIRVRIIITMGFDKMDQSGDSESKFKLVRMIIGSKSMRECLPMDNTMELEDCRWEMEHISMVISVMG